MQNNKLLLLKKLQFPSGFNLFISNIKTKFIPLFSYQYVPAVEGFSEEPSFAASTQRVKMPSNGIKKKIFKYGLPVIFLAAVLIVAFNFIRMLPDAKTSTTAIVQSEASNNTNPVASFILNKKFTFPLKDDAGRTVGNFDYVLENAELRKQIVIQGRSATAISGREFLVLNLKITNSLDKAIQLNTRDYLRVIVPSNISEQLAPDIHNDPVEVQAISTKYTRVGLTISDQDAAKIIKLKVGEIEGNKEDIDLNFKK